MKPFIKKVFFFIAAVNVCPILYGMEYQQHSDVLKMLRETDRTQQEIFLNARGSSGDTSLISAVRVGSVDEVSFLIEAHVKAHVNLDAQNWYGNSALFEAIRMKNSVIALILIDAGANINDRDRGDRTPLIKATENGCSDVALRLIAKGALVNVKDMHGTTPFMNAVIHGPIEVVEALLKAGARVNDKDRYEYTVWEMATPEARTAIEAFNAAH